jgi:Fe-S oxidoreductase
MDTKEGDVSLLGLDGQEYCGVPFGRRGRFRDRDHTDIAYQMLRNEIVEAEVANDLVQVNCSNCSKGMQKKYPERHSRIKHCRLTWIKGSDPIYFNDENL